jgi:hypothetical protein
LQYSRDVTAKLLIALLSILFPLSFLYAAEDKDSWQAEWQKTVQAAKKEEMT